jgi:pilus assembly protein CpaB
MINRIKLNRTFVVLGMALLTGGGTAFLASRYITNKIEDIEAKEKNKAMVRLIVPVEDLPKGTKITEKNVAVRDVPKEWAHSAAVTEAQFDRVENGVLSMPAVHGEPIIWSQLEGLKAPAFSAHLAPGRRAITVPVDDISSLSGMLEPGDLIDIVCYIRKDNKLVMFTVLQGVTVLAAGTKVSQKSEDPEGKEKTFNTVTLDTSPQDAQRVIAARELGKITALLRAPGDTATVADTKNDAMELLGLGGVAAGRAGIPVIYGGSGNRLTDINGASMMQSPNQGKLAEGAAALGALLGGAER